jgi:predicted enzyme related to lactoylglutathione lyase
LKITAITIDADDVTTVAEFWAGALDRKVVGDAAEGYVFVGEEGTTDRMCVQHTPDDKSTKNRWHFDFESEDRAKEVERLTALGATVSNEHDDWVVLADPEGNLFCVF